MATIAGFEAERYAQVVQGVLDDTSFEVGVGANELPMTPLGKLPFTSLSNGDVIMYRAVSLEDSSIWEVGKVAYDSTNEQLDRLDASVIESSNSGNTVDFKRADGSGMNVLVTGISLVSLTNAYTITNFTADRALAGDSTTALDMARTLATLVNDLIEAGIITGTVA
jgi:hypothetical protein